jgi:hypothetical protein
MDHLGITYNYETNTATMCYAPTDAPSFAKAGLVTVEFEITDENVIEAHEFMAENAVKTLSSQAVSGATLAA